MDPEPPPPLLPNGDSTQSTTSAPPIQPIKPAHLPESLKLEHQFVRVPFEHYKKSIRSSSRFAEKEIFSVVASVSQASNRESVSREEAVGHLSSLVSRLHGLKRKLEEESKTEKLRAQKCRARLDHLNAEDENSEEWNDTRLKRIIVDYLLRLSCFDTAIKLADCGNIEDFVDIEVFREAKNVIDALNNKQVSPALAWCAENRSRLKKSKSKFEFLLRLQEFVELVRADNNLEAIAYSRKYLSPWGTTHMKDLQRVMAILAFKSSTECAGYKVLFDPKQWEYLVEQFKQEFCRLYGMNVEPLLNIYLQAGLSALKTPYPPCLIPWKDPRFCYENDCTKEDPLSQESFRKLANPLPFSKQHHSKLVCYITKELMDTENPPMALPNGYVYSTKALEEIATKNDGKVTCPRTGLVCNYSELVKVFIS